MTSTKPPDEGVRVSGVQGFGLRALAAGLRDSFKGFRGEGVVATEERLSLYQQL